MFIFSVKYLSHVDIVVINKTGFLEFLWNFSLKHIQSFFLNSRFPTALILSLYRHKPNLTF